MLTFWSYLPMIIHSNTESSIIFVGRFFLIQLHRTNMGNCGLLNIYFIQNIYCRKLISFKGSLCIEKRNVVRFYFVPFRLTNTASSCLLVESPGFNVRCVGSIGRVPPISTTGQKKKKKVLFHPLK